MIGVAVAAVAVMGIVLFVLESLGVIGNDGEFRIMFVGASVTEGYYASEDAAAYPAATVSDLQDKGAVVDPLVVGRAGSGTAEVLGWRLEGTPDAMVLQVATNDFGRGLTLQQYRKNYGAILTGLRLLGPRAKLLCLGGWRSPTEVNGAGVTGAQFDAVTLTVCNESGGRFVSLARLFQDPANHGPKGRGTFKGPADYFHPNDRGHKAIADLVVRNLGTVPTR